MSLVGALLVLRAGVATASPVVFYVDPAVGDIVKVDPRTGTELGRFAAPLTPRRDDTRLGLSMAGKDRLLFQLGNGDRQFLEKRTTLFRLDPNTGVIMSTALGLATFFGPDGLS